jgi:hypothetical protein
MCRTQPNDCSWQIGFEQRGLRAKVQFELRKWGHCDLLVGIGIVVNILTNEYPDMLSGVRADRVQFYIRYIIIQRCDYDAWRRGNVIWPGASIR